MESKSIDALTEATSKLKIDQRRSDQNNRSSNNQYRTQNRQQNNDKSQTSKTGSYASKNQQSQFGNSSNNNSNGFDRSKIMGFQNKQTNELAMNLLKAQGLLDTSATPPTVLATASTGPNTFVTAATAAPIYNPPPPQPAANTAVFALPTTMMQQSAPRPPQGMMTGGVGGWPWKVGDLCFAKYWDDGMVSSFCL